MSGTARILVAQAADGTISSTVEVVGMRRRDVVRALRGVINQVQTQPDQTPADGVYPPPEVMPADAMAAHVKGAAPEHDMPARGIPTDVHEYHRLLHENGGAGHTHQPPSIGYEAVPPADA